MTESVRIRTLRQDLAELRDPGAHDGPGHALFLALQKSYTEELQLLGASVQPEEIRRPTLRPAAAVIKPAPKQAVSETIPAIPETIPTIPATTLPIPEPKAPMSTKTKSATPEEKAAARRKYQREWWAKKSASKQSTPRPRIQVAQQPAAPVQPGPEPLVIDHTSHISPLHGLDALQSPRDSPLPEAVARLRALRIQALEVLPACEGLSREAGYAVRHQIDLLADVLAMADRLAREAS